MASPHPSPVHTNTHTHHTHTPLQRCNDAAFVRYQSFFFFEWDVLWVPNPQLLWHDQDCIGNSNCSDCTSGSVSGYTVFSAPPKLTGEKLDFPSAKCWRRRRGGQSTQKSGWIHRNRCFAQNQVATRPLLHLAWSAGVCGGEDKSRLVSKEALVTFFVCCGTIHSPCCEIERDRKKKNREALSRYFDRLYQHVHFSNPDAQSSASIW